jgi:hypothetical protein
MPILDAARKFIHGLRTFLERQGVVPASDSAGFMGDLFERFPFTARARTWLRQNVHVEVVDLSSTGGGGGYHVGRRTVRLNSAQYEAAIHELAHALWEDQRLDRPVRDGLVAAVRRLAEDPDPRWTRVRELAQHYVFGILTQPGFERGMLLPRHERGTGGGPEGEWNDWEMFAGLASGCMADVRLLPPYVRRYYLRLFEELPPGAPRPESRAPHR